MKLDFYENIRNLNVLLLNLNVANFFFTTFMNVSYEWLKKKEKRADMIDGKKWKRKEKTNKKNIQPKA